MRPVKHIRFNSIQFDIQLLFSNPLWTPQECDRSSCTAAFNFCSWLMPRPFFSRRLIYLLVTSSFSPRITPTISRQLSRSLYFACSLSYCSRLLHTYATIFLAHLGSNRSRKNGDRVKNAWTSLLIANGIACAKPHGGFGRIAMVNKEAFVLLFRHSDRWGSMWHDKTLTIH